SQGDTFAASVGCPGTDAQAAACLRQKPADDLLKAGGGGSTGGATAIPLRPIVDGNIVPDQPEKLVGAGKWAKGPVVGSHTADEATVTVLLQTQQQGSSFTAEQFPDELQKLVTTSGLNNLDQVTAAYPLSKYPSPDQAVAAARTDPTACRINEAAKVYSKQV